MFFARPGRLVPLMDTLPAAGRRQDLSPVLALNGAVYVADVAHLRRHGTFLTRNSLAYEMPRDRSIDIDDEIDLRIAEALLPRERDVDLAA
jgi:N-acylneuraminate cytidylyltransferase